MGEMPMTGSMFAFADYAIMLRNLDTSTPAYLNAEVDLFRAPADERRSMAFEKTFFGGAYQDPLRAGESGRAGLP